MDFVLLHLVIVVAVGLRILLRQNRQPDSRAAWLLVVIALPYLGAISYVLLGETDIGHRRVARMKQVLTALPRPDGAEGWSVPDNAASIPELYQPRFQVGRSMSG